jgi:hypothetical protein
MENSFEAEENCIKKHIDIDEHIVQRFRIQGKIS